MSVRCQLMMLSKLCVCYFYLFIIIFCYINLIRRPVTTLRYRRASSDDPKGCNLPAILMVAGGFRTYIFIYNICHVYILIYIYIYLQIVPWAPMLYLNIEVRRVSIDNGGFCNLFVPNFFPKPLGSFEPILTIFDNHLLLKWVVQPPDILFRDTVMDSDLPILLF